MAAKPIDNLSIVVSANTRPLAQDLAGATRAIEQFEKKAGRVGQRVRGPDGLPAVRENVRVRQGSVGAFAPDRQGRAFAQFNRDQQRAQQAAAAEARREAVRAAAAWPARAAWAGMKWVGRRLWDDDATNKGRAAAAAKAKEERAAGSTGAGAAGGDAGKNPAAAKARETGLALASAVPSGFRFAASMVAVELGLSGVAGAFNKVKQSVVMAGELEQTTLAFEVMLKSGERAKTLMADMRKYAATTTFGLKEITGSTRMLTAYGVAADQLMPTMRMLGDVSAAFGKELPIRDLTYLYGTLFAQQRAYAIDIRQFAGRGIPIYEELATVLGKTNAEVKQLIEDGRVSSREVTQAFVNMTSAGGRFYGMTERQGKTFLGQLEQMQDAWRLAQTKFGQVLIEELGLAEATRDLDAFAKRLETGMDEIRPAVRFLGELGRGAVQLTYELGRAAAVMAELNIGALDRAFPGLRQAAESFRQLVRDAATFKFDDEKLINFAADAASAVVRTFAAVVDAITAVVDAGVRKLDPLIRVVGWVDQKLNGNALADRQPGMRIDAANPIAPPPAGISPDRVREEWGAMASRLLPFQREAAFLLQGAGGNPRALQGPDAARYQAVQGEIGRLIDMQRAYRGAFEGDPNDVFARLNRGDIPAIRGAPPPLPAAGGPADQSLRDRLLGGIESMRGTLLGDARQRKAEAEQLRLAAEARRTADALAAFRRNMVLAGNGWHDLGVALGRGQATGYAEAGALGGAFSVADAGRTRLAAERGGHGVVLPDVFPHLDEMARELRREYDPRPELANYRSDLTGIRDRQLLGADTNAITARAWDRKVGEVAQRLGLGGPARLPDAVLAGGAEDARLMNTYRTMAGQQTTEQLLTQLLDVARQQLTAQQATAKLADLPPPPAIKAGP